MTNLEKLYRDLASAHELPVETVEKICRSEFKFTRESAEGDTFPLIRWDYLGKFVPMPVKLARYKDSKWWDKENNKTIKP